MNIYIYDTKKQLLRGSAAQPLSACSRNDCFIGNDQRFLDPLNVRRNKDFIHETNDLMDAFFLVPLTKKKQHQSATDVFLPLETMMRFRFYNSLPSQLQNQIKPIWLNKNLTAITDIEAFQQTIIKDITLPSQRMIQHESIKKKLKPGIDHDSFLLQHVMSITKVDWQNATNFENLPSVPDDLAQCEVLRDNIGQGKVLGPLFHYSGFLPYIMKNFDMFPDCNLRKKYKEYPVASWPHAFSCAHGCQNIYSKEGRDKKCSHIVYVAESSIPLKDIDDEKFSKFLKWVDQQRDLYITEKGEENIKIQFVLNDDVLHIFQPLPDVHNTRTELSKETRSNVKTVFLQYTSKYVRRISVTSTLPFIAQDSDQAKRKFDFMHVMSDLSLAVGDTSDYGYQKQLLCSPCFRDEPLFDYAEDEDDTIGNDLLIDQNIEEEDGPNLSEQQVGDQKLSQRQLQRKSKRSTPSIR